MSRKKTKAKAMRRVTLTVDPDDYSTINRLAKRIDVSASWVIRRCMHEFLEHHEGECSLDVRSKRQNG